MIVVDVLVVANLMTKGPLTKAAQRAMKRDREWVAPESWEADFLDVLAEQVWLGDLSIEEALGKFAAAKVLVKRSHEVIVLAEAFAISKEFSLTMRQATAMWISRKLQSPYVTADPFVLNALPREVINLDSFGAADPPKDNLPLG